MTYKLLNKNGIWYPYFKYRTDVIDPFGLQKYNCLWRFKSTLSMIKTEPLSTAKKVNRERKKSFIINSAAADMMIENVKSDLTDNDAFIEIDPGKGLLTRRLLTLPNKRLLLYEPSRSLIKNLEYYQPEQLKNISVSNMNIHFFYRYYFESKFNLESVKYRNFIEGLKSHSKPSTNLKILGTISYPSFFFSLLSCYAFQVSFFEDYLEPTFYLFVPFKVYASIFKVIKNFVSWRLGIVTNFYFNVTCLGHLPKSNFKISYKTKIHNVKNWPELKNLYLLKFTPKDINLLKEETGGEVTAFNFFLNYLIRIKIQSSLISSAENFIPGCGEELIKNGFKVFDHPQLMSEEQWFRAFRTFVSHPGFKSSPFMEEFRKHHHIIREDWDRLPFDMDEEEHYVLPAIEMEEPSCEKDEASRIDQK